jgi:hypothetical protein
MPTPFDDVIDSIRTAGYHNHRLEGHSDLVSTGLFRDLLARCQFISKDFDAKIINKWVNVPAPGTTRGRKVDLFVGEDVASHIPDVSKVRICVENKSVVTAHRNKTNRLDDLEEVIGAIHRHKAEAIVVATIMVGTATRVLNIPDHVKKRYRNEPGRFESEVLPRLSSGDETLWKEFDYAISKNRPDDPAKTVDAFRKLPLRGAGHTHVEGYDFVLIVPVFVDNVHPPSLCHENAFGIEIEAEYERMLATICRAYEARWHL